MSTPRHFWCSHKRITTTTVRCSKTSQPDCITPQTQAGRDTAPHLNQDENVQHGADSKENLLPANQKDYFIMPHMNGNEADPSSRSLALSPTFSSPNATFLPRSLSPCLHQLHIQRSAAQQYILPMQNSNYSSLLGWDYTHMTAEIWQRLDMLRFFGFFSDDSSIFLFFSFRKPIWEETKIIFLNLCCWAYQKSLHRSFRYSR